MEDKRTHKGTARLKTGLAEMLKGGVIMDVVAATQAKIAQDAGAVAVDALPYTFEPSAERLLATLVPRAIEVEIFRAVLENQAGEHAARMTAMERATRNTKDLIESLTLEYNRARQAAITKELVEIVSGAQALE